MRCFDTMTVQCLSSSKLMLRREDSGLHCCKPMALAFASKSLTETESRYSNIEGEMLGILFGLERFHQYVYGRHVEVHTDHKPLESIYTKHIFAAPPRLARMLRRIQQHDVSIKYVPGSDVKLADALSRVTRDLSESLACLCTNYTCILMRVQLVLWKFAWKHRKTALCMRYVRSYQSAGQRTEHIARRI